MNITSTEEDGLKILKRSKSSLSNHEEADYQEDNIGGESNLILKKGPWTSSEDAILIDYVKNYGERHWNTVRKHYGLARCGKSCRLRWLNHLRPDLKKGAFTEEEEYKIIELHSKMGNKWARMTAQLPGRTDNEIKNYWNTRIKRMKRAGLPIYPIEMLQQGNDGDGENLNTLTNEASQQDVLQRDNIDMPELPTMVELSSYLSPSSHMLFQLMNPPKFPWDSVMIDSVINNVVQPRLSSPYDLNNYLGSSSLCDNPDSCPRLSSPSDIDTYRGLFSLCDNPDIDTSLPSLSDFDTYLQSSSLCDNHDTYTGFPSPSDLDTYLQSSSLCDNPDTYTGLPSPSDLDTYLQSSSLCDNPDTFTKLSSPSHPNTYPESDSYPRTYSPCEPDKDPCPMFSSPSDFDFYPGPLCDTMLNTGDQFHEGNFTDNHATSNGNNSSSKPISGVMRFELPSLQNFETQQCSWGMPTSPPLPPLESIDTLIRSPPTKPNQSVVVSPESGLLESKTWQFKVFKC